MRTDTLTLIVTFARGCLMVVGQIVLVAVLLLWGLQAVAMLYGEAYDWVLVLQHLILSMTFLAFFPGQQVWSFHLEDARGRVVPIVGKPPEAGR